MAKRNNKYKSLVAKVLRERKMRGETLTDSEKLWLEEYDAKKKSGSNDAEPAFKSQVPIGIVEPETKDEPQIDGGPPPLEMGGGGYSPSGSSEPDSSSEDEGYNPEVVERDEHNEEGVAAAHKYCEWLKVVNGDIAKLGGIAIPDELVDGLVFPAAKGVFTRLAKTYLGSMSEGKEDAVVLVSGIASYGQRHILRARAEEKARRTPAASTSPKNGETKSPSQGNLRSVPQLPLVRHKLGESEG